MHTWEFLIKHTSGMVTYHQVMLVGSELAALMIMDDYFNKMDITVKVLSIRCRNYLTNQLTTWE